MTDFKEIKPTKEDKELTQEDIDRLLETSLICDFFVNEFPEVDDSNIEDVP